MAAVKRSSAVNQHLCLLPDYQLISQLAACALTLRPPHILCCVQEPSALSSKDFDVLVTSYSSGGFSCFSTAGEELKHVARERRLAEIFSSVRPEYMEETK